MTVREAYSGAMALLGETGGAGLSNQPQTVNRILAVVKALGEVFPDKNIVLVSKDINMRIKATALGLAAEDYFNDKTIDDTDLLYTGRTVVEPDFWEKQVENLQSWQADGRTWYSFEGPLAGSLSLNEFVTTSDGSFAAQVKVKSAGTATLATLKDYMQPKNAVWGVHARNIEQSLALNLLMDPEIDFVTLLGQAGTGKTLITLAAALTQTLDAVASDGSSVTFAVTEGTLPAGLTLSGNTISGTPLATGSTVVKITASAGSASMVITVTFLIAAAPDKMYFGYITSAVAGSTVKVTEITSSMVDAALEAETMQSLNPVALAKTSIGTVPAGALIAVLIPAAAGMKASKFDGISAKVEFELDNAVSGSGANGAAVTLDGKSYKVWGEFALVAGERFIYVDKEA